VAGIRPNGGNETLWYPAETALWQRVVGGVLKFSELIIGGMLLRAGWRTTIITRVDAKVKRLMLAAEKGFNEIPAAAASSG